MEVLGALTQSHRERSSTDNADAEEHAFKFVATCQRLFREALRVHNLVNAIFKGITQLLGSHREKNTIESLVLLSSLQPDQVWCIFTGEI